MELNFKDFKRFEKQIVLKKIGISGQKKIKNSKVLIIGMGGLGCPLLTYLVSAGVSNIGIVDHDKIELSNLNRQTLFNSSDIRKFKVNVAKEKLLKTNPHCKIVVHSEYLIKDNIKLLKEFDIIKFIKML